jgi:hypothetical protein
MQISTSIIRLGLTAILVLVLSIRRDGFFPFSSDINPLTWSWLLVIQVVLLFTLLIFFLKPELIERTVKKIPWGLNLPAHWILLVLVNLLIVFILVLHLSSSQAFPEYFHFGRDDALAFALLTIPLVSFPILTKKPFLMVFSLFFATIILALIPIYYYEITANTADLLPIIQKQLDAFVQGQNIYQYFSLDNGVVTQAVRQPGTTLSFLPAFLTGLDIRFMSLIYTLLTGVVLLKFQYRKLQDAKFDTKFLITFVALTLFLLFPYRHVRHDLYEPFYWFLISLSLYWLYTNRLKMFAVTWALGIFTQVWFWLFTPFVAVYIWRKYSFKKSLVVMGTAVAIGGGLLSVFILKNPAAYLEHVLGFYAGEIAKGSYAASTIHLTPLVTEYGLGKLLLPLQLVSVGLLGLWTLLRVKTWEKLLAALMLTFTLFVQFNSVSWNYMYIGLVVLMLFYSLSTETLKGNP